MLAVILEAGKGTRLQSVNVCSSKCLLPINGISMLGKKIKQLAQSEYIDKIIIVIRKEQTEIPQLMGKQCMNVPISFAFQEEGKNGIVNAQIYDFSWNARICKCKWFVLWQ
ncbi:sugar phosphate nucleotidyltransferase [[Clostridium] polysaccharolyticum]|uniref:Nucleotidyl transferase n=1 Tax=[Clostridium] polysaccharolyticum TaxID=29364 RepID=A0A1I0DYH2_9FIRM|nr:sugar phosphate nucleotidyltransferase [[Clostridium] polysaccharolyticum]SET37755.1 Nucleotidyl transferase [[Clostridium] polysaccharolyticum]